MMPSVDEHHADDAGIESRWVLVHAPPALCDQTSVSSRGIPVRTSQPSSRTTTRSSIRTPKLPGHVDARLDRDDVAGSRARPRRAGANARRLVDLEPDPVAECRGRTARPCRPASIGSRAAASTAAHVRARALTAASAAACAAAHQLVGLAWPRRRARRWRRCACSRSSSRRACSRGRRRPACRAGSRRLRGSACGSAPLSAAATIGGKETAVGADVLRAPLERRARPRARCGRPGRASRSASGRGRRRSSPRGESRPAPLRP